MSGFFASNVSVTADRRASVVAMNKTPTITTARYVRAHGPPPKCFAVWSFQMSAGAAARCDELVGPAVDYVGTFESATAWARTHFATSDLPFIALLPQPAPVRVAG